nr:MOSC domain-containing protein [uncultured Dethiosulfovibrio sp.]
MAILRAVCVSDERCNVKVPLKSGRFLFGGLEGDAHFGFSEREVSLLREEDVKEAEREAGFEFPFGCLAENLTVAGLPEYIPLGSVLQIGTARLEVLEKGKSPGEPHSYDYRGWCLLPKVGFFLKVIREGYAAPGNEVLLEIA